MTTSLFQRKCQMPNHSERPYMLPNWEWLKTNTTLHAYFPLHPPQWYCPCNLCTFAFIEPQRSFNVDPNNLVQIVQLVCICVHGLPHKQWVTQTINCNNLRGDSACQRCCCCWNPTSSKAKTYYLIRFMPIPTSHIVKIPGQSNKICYFLLSFTQQLIWGCRNQHTNGTWLFLQYFLFIMV